MLGFTWWCRYGDEEGRGEEVRETIDTTAAVSEITGALKEAISFSANCQRVVQVTPVIACPLFYRLLAFHHSWLDQFVAYVCTDDCELSSNEVTCEL